MRTSFWNIETNEQRKVAGPYASCEAAIEARWYFPSSPKLYVVEYETINHPDRAAIGLSYMAEPTIEKIKQLLRPTPRS